MSAELSLYGANQIMDGSSSMPATLYLKVHLGNPGPSGLLLPAAEVTRVAFTRTASVLGACANVADLIWSSAAALEDWTHWSAWSHLTVGNCWLVGTFASTVVVTAGDTVKIDDGDMDLSITVWS